VPKPKRQSPLSIRLTAETTERLELAAEETGISKHALAQMAVEAAIRAIAENGYKIVLPIKFDVTHVPQPRSYPAHRPQQMIMEEREREENGTKSKKGKK
jgi:hypothetical protein